MREFSLATGEDDYLLFVGGKAASVIETKPPGDTPAAVKTRSTKYVVKLYEDLADGKMFHNVSTGNETLFRDTGDPHAHSRRVFAFH